MPGYKYLPMVSIAVWVGFILAEVLLMLTGFMNTYPESRYGFYQSAFTYNTKNVYNILTASTPVTEDSPEFSYTYQVNSLGFTGGEWPQQPDSNTYRIITLGDSFTEGIGAPSDSAYPALLQNLLTENGLKVRVLNAGASGSDPVFGYKNLHDRLLRYKPDLVIQTISENDVLNDFGVKGGFERFKTDSTLQSHEQDKLEIIYAISHTSRIFLNIAGYNYKRPHCMGKEADCIVDKNKILEDVVTRYSLLAEANNFKVLFVFYPTKYENTNAAYYFDFNPAKAYMAHKKQVSSYDLMPCYKNVFRNEQGYKGFYWNVDGHHNGDGYRVMAECVANGIQEKGLLPIPATQSKQ